MVERLSPLRPDERLQGLKRDILTRWEQLPSDHQARVTLVLLRKLFDRQQQDLFADALKTLGLAVMPDHLRQAGLTDAEIARLTDDDKEQVVQRVVTHFVHDAIWDELEFAARKTLYDRDQDRDTSPNHG